MSGKYLEAYQQSLNNPEEFWGNAAKAIDWDLPATKILDDSNAPIYRWFSGGKLNTCYNALDRHVKNGRADQAPLQTPKEPIPTKSYWRKFLDSLAF